MTLVTAPFTQAQVDSLNDYQRSGFWHEFTCGNDHAGDNTLVAMSDGWTCPSFAVTGSAGRTTGWPTGRGA